MIERRLLWVFLVALLAVDGFLLFQRGRMARSLRDLQSRSANAIVESAYADEEQALLTKARTVPAAFPRASTDAKSGVSSGVEFVLVASIDDCTNCIEDEIVKLNELAAGNPRGAAGIAGFFVDEDRLTTARRFIDHLSPAPRFPISVRDVLAELPEATTPLVLVIRSRDRKILDTHKPLPQNLAKRDAFYVRWAALTASGRESSSDGPEAPASGGR